MSREYWKPGNMLYPVPAVMVSCGREGEKPNIITVAWAGTVCSDPPMVSISVRKERYSYGIIRETGEFVINLVNRELVRAADYCGVKSGRDEDKFAAMGLTAQPSRYVKAPGIGESPVSLECRVTQRLELGSHDMFLTWVNIQCRWNTDRRFWMVTKDYSNQHLFLISGLRHWRRMRGCLCLTAIGK